MSNCERVRSFEVAKYMRNVHDLMKDTYGKRCIGHWRMDLEPRKRHIELGMGGQPPSVGGVLDLYRLKYLKFR